MLSSEPIATKQKQTTKNKHDEPSVRTSILNYMLPCLMIPNFQKKPRTAQTSSSDGRGLFGRFYNRFWKSCRKNNDPTVSNQNGNFGKVELETSKKELKGERFRTIRGESGEDSEEEVPCRAQSIGTRGFEEFSREIQSLGRSIFCFRPFLILSLWVLVVSLFWDSSKTKLYFCFSICFEI